MRPAFGQYVSGYVWRGKTLHPERQGEQVKVKARTEDSQVFVEFEDGTRVMVDKCCVRRMK
jgi:predicted homoserine dehydrogenase-like protein